MKPWKRRAFTKSNALLVAHCNKNNFTGVNSNELPRLRNNW
jgi:hypothetical protein